MTAPFERELSPTELAALPDESIDYSDIPELDDAFFATARLIEPDRTRAVTLRVKASVLDAFKAEGKDYQTRMNAVLETYARAKLRPRPKASSDPAKASRS